MVATARLERRAQGRHVVREERAAQRDDVSLNGNRSYGSPSAAPNGSIGELLFADGTSGRAHARHGGNGFSARVAARSAPGVNQRSGSANNKHRSLRGELRRESYDQDQTSNANGTFTIYVATRRQSTSDVPRAAAAHPTRSAHGRALLGDSYRRTNKPRSSTACASTRIAHRADVPRARAALRRAERPCRILYASPRSASPEHGTAPTIAGFEGAARGPRAVVRGGISLPGCPPQPPSVRPSTHRAGWSVAATHVRRCSGAGAGLPRTRRPLRSSRCADGSTAASSPATPNATLSRATSRSQLERSILGNRLSELTSPGRAT